MAQIAKQRFVSAKSVLAHHFFTRGMRDYVAGKPFDPDYEKWPYMPQRKYQSAQWSYERGRQFAAATKGLVQTKIGSNGKIVNPDAIREFMRLYNEKAII